MIMALTHFKCLRTSSFQKVLSLITLWKDLMNYTFFDTHFSKSHTILYFRIRSKKKCQVVAVWRVSLPCMYSSKHSMSPVHNSRVFNTRRLRLARLLLASSTSVLVSIHIVAAVGPRRYKCDK